MQSSAVMNQTGKIMAVLPRMRNNKNKLSGKAGSIISAVITSRENGKTMLKTKENIVLQFADENVKGDIGEEVFFEVVSADDKQISLRQTENPFQETQKHMKKQMNLSELKDLMQKSDFIEPEENILAPKSLQELNSQNNAKMAEAIKKIRRQLTYASGSVTQSAVTELLNSGISLEKISIRMLNSVTNEISELPKEETSENIRSKEIARTVSELRSKISEMSEISDEAITQLVKNGEELTIENIYVSKYSSSGTE